MANNKNIWVDNLDLFKIHRTYPTQHLCVCSQDYQTDLDMQVGDIVFMKDIIKPKSYRRLGEIRGFNRRKIIVGIMADIGIGCKSKIERLALNNEVTEE